MGKFLAAAIAKFLYRYSWNQAFTIWSLSMPQVAATLALVLTSFSVELISDIESGYRTPDRIFINMRVS
ncbi:MAG: hypothetical protein F6K24_00005 [Okeania sp. SIO2D1]|uniref:hypothetical protein n=1 Tax=Okeania sp. SIO2C9 TaxID=2607791 RepID=UPI0013B97C68|nr:hypothetical protein [Okeania sp. SIO2C9]NEQ72146.1 hypothetical protein [Okeania sp. SIO2C9]NES63793.1 hypothetical protein [Okeania sp. SIO2D1]